VDGLTVTDGVAADAGAALSRTAAADIASRANALRSVPARRVV